MSDTSHLLVRAFDRHGKARLQRGNEAGMVGTQDLPCISVCPGQSHLHPSRVISRAVATEPTCPPLATSHSNIIALVVRSPRTSGSGTPLCQGTALRRVFRVAGWRRSVGFAGPGSG
jgi:hypothetical protein